MKFTLNLPMASGRFQAIPPDQYLAVARAAEAAGFHHLSVPDNVIFPRAVSGLWARPLDPDRLRELESLGVTDLLVTPWLFGGAADDSIESKRHCLERFGAELIGALR